MKKLLLPCIVLFLFTFMPACRHKYYANTFFEEQTKDHKVIAILPAEMIFTGKQPKELTTEDIQKIEETESTSFEYALYNSVMHYANSNTYETTINIKDITSVLKTLEDNKISIRDSWKKDDKELAQLLGVDAVVRLRIQKQRYMSDVASYGVSVAKQVIYNTGLGGKIPIPTSFGKTNDIYASCNLLSNNLALWNDSYKAASDWNSPSNEIIENITDNFGRHFPYKRRRG